MCLRPRDPGGECVAWAPVASGTIEGAPGTAPQKQLGDREAPRTGLSVSDGGSSQETSPLDKDVTSVATALSSSMPPQAPQEPARSMRFGGPASWDSGAPGCLHGSYAGTG
jgi:hypothetical protein